jgi:uncharacterized protein
MIAVNTVKARTIGGQLSVAWMIVLHLLPGALAMLLMITAGPLLERVGIFPSVPVIFVFVAPVLFVMQLSFLFYKARQLNGNLSLAGIVLYRDQPMPWWKIVATSLPLFAWFAFVWFVIKPPVNDFFITRFFTWIPAYFLDDTFLSNLHQYSPTFLRVIGVLFALSITFGGVVEELYFRGYLLPRIESLGIWAPLVHTILFSLYHFWTPWENAARLLALFPWIFTVWRTRNLYLSILIHFTVNAFSGISMLSLILGLT